MTVQYLNPTHARLLGPQVPAGSDARATWFDKVQHEKGLEHGSNLPKVPPTDPAAHNQYELTQYYGLPENLYAVHARNKDPRHLENARKAADSWWRWGWIDEGRMRPWYDSAEPAPRMSNIGSLILRASDGRPEMWDWIASYTRAALDIWLKWRIDNKELWAGIREGAFALRHAVLVSQTLPDSYPLQQGGQATNGAELRAGLLRDAEEVAVRYFGRLQRPDGSWRYDTAPGEMQGLDPGETLRQTTQPFQLGILSTALCTLHAASKNEEVKSNVMKQVVACLRFLWAEGGPYRREVVPDFGGICWRSFWYFWGGGTSVDPSRFEKGGWSETDTTKKGWSTVKEERQGVTLVIPSCGYAWSVTREPWLREMGDELWDAAFGAADAQHCLMDQAAKMYNQSAGAGSYLAWTQAADAPVPRPTTGTTTTPTTPTSTPSSTPPQYEYVSKTWPSSAAARLSLLTQTGQDGYLLAQVVATTAYFYRLKR